MNRVRRPTSADGVLHLLSRVVVPADKLEAIDNLDRVELLTDVIPELSEIRSVAMKSVSPKLVTCVSSLQHGHLA
jgi:hypothetical protein